MKTFTVEEIRAKRAALPPGAWFWKCDRGYLTLFRTHPYLRGWREVLCARRLGMDGATMEVADLSGASYEDPDDPWESCQMVRVTRHTDISDLLVMDWLAESPAYVDELLYTIDQLRAERAALRAELKRAVERQRMRDQAEASPAEEGDQ